jgi:hypothetical protein
MIRKASLAKANRRSQWRRSKLPPIIALPVLLLLSGCDTAYEETLVGRYKLLAIDIHENMQLCWALDSGTCASDGLPGRTVFAAGFDDRYVVTAVHPDGAGGTITQFFYVIRDRQNEDDDWGMPYGGVKGPFDQSEYEAEKSRLNLPEFSRIFANLK